MDLLGNVRMEYQSETSSCLSPLLQQALYLELEPQGESQLPCSNLDFPRATYKRKQTKKQARENIASHRLGFAYDLHSA